jgi:hypothetical protein
MTLVLCGRRCLTVETVASGALLALAACSGSVQPVELAPPAAAPAPLPAPPAPAPLPFAVTLSWRAPQTRVDGSPLRNLAGYRVRYGTSPGVYSTVLDVKPGAVTELTVSLLAPGQYWFVVTAVDANGLESGYSNEATAVR